MINLIIYLNSESEAKTLVNDLLTNRLVASASIDSDNEYYTILEGQVCKTIHTVITAQTKANLFSSIEAFVAEKIGIKPPIFSLPITQTNDNFADDIRSRTKQVDS
ncbi:MAG: divalent cation tolerance protein CutA [Crocinitomicaceae bacterium]